MIYWNWTKWMFHWCREINQCLFSSRALGLLSLFIPSCHFAHTNSFSLLPEPCLRPWQVSQPDVSKWSPSSQYWSTSDISRIEQKQSCSRESNLIRHNQLIQSPNTHLFLRQWGERKKQEPFLQSNSQKHFLFSFFLLLFFMTNEVSEETWNIALTVISPSR